MQDDESAISHTRLAYLPALDGVRACAVLAVMMFHGGIPHMDGGFMGVDAFFVLSGFLITSLLIGEWRQSLTIKLGAFWARRARRLLPALLLMLLFVAFFASVIVPKGTYGALRLDALATLLYVSNWHFILVNSNYFNETSASSPLLHTWSLAVEEQFYVIWPLVVLGVLHFTRSLRALFALCCAAAIASAVWMSVVYDGGVNTNRAYLGTDTRSQCLFIGCALAVGLVLLTQRSHEEGRLAKGELWRPEGTAGPGGLRGAGRHRGGRGHQPLGPHHFDVLLPLLGRVLPHRAFDRLRDPLGRRRTAQHRPAAAVAVPGPLCGPDLLRALHLALAHLHLAGPRPHGALRVRALRGARPRHLRRVGRVVPSRRAPDPHGDIRQPVAGVAGRARRRRRRAGRCHRGHDGDDRRRQLRAHGGHRHDGIVDHDHDAQRR